MNMRIYATIAGAALPALLGTISSAQAASASLDANKTLIAQPPLAKGVNIASVSPPLPDGSNAAVFVRFAQGAAQQDKLTVAPDGRPIALNDAGILPDRIARDGIFSGFATLDLDALAAKEKALAASVEAADGPHVTVFSGRGAVSTERFAPADAEPFASPAEIKTSAGVSSLTPLPFPLLGSAILPAAFSASSTLMITDPGVVGDPKRTFDPCDTDHDGLTGDVDGPWSFKTLMSNMANTPLTGIAPQKFVHEWLRRWMVNDVVNTFPIPARPAIAGFFPGWDGKNPKTLDINRLPFRLLAIVNRMDLGQSSPYGKSQAGETRFVFGLVDPKSCALRPMTVIFEYGDVEEKCEQQQARAQQWIDLDGWPLGSPDYNDALQALTDTVTLPNAAPAKPNGSALNQLRTNEIAFAAPWELREFKLKAPISTLLHDTIKQTPDSPSFDNSGILANYMETNALPILCEQHTVPTTFGVFPFLGSRVGYNFGDFWNAPTNPALLPPVLPFCHQTSATLSIPPTPAEIQSELRQKFSLNTCNACHAGETSTAFTHIDPLTPPPASLSGFLAGIPGPVPTPALFPVNDPAGSGLTRTFNDLLRRQQILQSIAKQSCTPFALGVKELIAPAKPVH